MKTRTRDSKVTRISAVLFTSLTRLPVEEYAKVRSGSVVVGGWIYYAPAGPRRSPGLVAGRSPVPESGPVLTSLANRFFLVKSEGM